MLNALFLVALYRIVSILVFVELALDVWDCDLSVDNQEFQSLFSWNLLLMSKTYPLYFRKLSVSILVFVELALDVPPSQVPTVATSVSILVFVELALDGRRAPVLGRLFICFNPCFRGTCS